MKIFAALLMCLFILSACSTKPEEAALKPLNLLEYGIPITIMAPDSAKVKKGVIGQYQDITVKKGDYKIQILGVNAISTNIQDLKANALQNAKEEGYFSRIVSEDEAGFIFESTIDSLNFYDFRYVVVKGDKEYNFRADMMSQLTLEQAERLYQAVKQ